MCQSPNHRLCTSHGNLLCPAGRFSSIAAVHNPLHTISSEDLSYTLALECHSGRLTLVQNGLRTATTTPCERFVRLESLPRFRAHDTARTISKIARHDGAIAHDLEKRVSFPRSVGWRTASRGRQTTGLAPIVLNRGFEICPRI
jgi:hypothetical protein